ncbi:MAG: hypothetical protein OXN84_18900 [Albidovulum sp.]|nr:hypothetical protein [Albidovulum sp.]
MPLTCGEAKGVWFDERRHVMPSDSECESKFKFTDAGNILPKDGGDMAARHMIEHLNLDDDELASDRKKVKREIEVILDSDFSEPEKLVQARSWCEPDDRIRMSGFAQVARRYFEEESGMRV